MKYVSLHNHTTGSVGDAIITPAELISLTKEAGQDAVAITDHGSLLGLWDAFKAAKQKKVKLIAGSEINFTFGDGGPLYHLVILAKNGVGYKNLLKLQKLGYDNQVINFKKSIPVVDFKMLSENSDGLICTTACGNGPVGQAIMEMDLVKARDIITKLSQVFGDDFALELQPHNLQRRASPYSGPINQQKINQHLKRFSEEMGIRAIVATDAHYAKKEDHKTHDVYLSIGSKQPVTSGNRLIYDKDDFYVKTADEVYSYFERHIKFWGEDFVKSLFDNTIYFADKCELPSFIDPAVSTGDKHQLPSFPYESEPDYDKFLEWKKTSTLVDDLPEDALFFRYRSETGLEAKIASGKIPEEDREYCIKQIKEEFDVFECRGFSSYMLIVADLLNWCENNGIPIGPGRGSVGASLTAYLCNIHKAYPKKYNLIFERFLNKLKDAFPDIDSDISPSGRDKLLAYLTIKYGEDNVAHVSNINTITPKVYARDIARAFNFGGMDRSTAAEIGNNIADSIPKEIKTVRKALEDAPLFAEYAKQYPELAQFQKLCGKPRALSTHAGGVIIGKVPLSEIVPLRRDTSGNLSVEYEKERAEENGLIKIDILGLETLDIVKNTISLIERSGRKV
jgi:DNA polymerase III subunit alpha